MRNSLSKLAAVFLLVAVSGPLWAGTPGSFRGTIVDAFGAASGKRWIYVQGRNGMARRVEVTRARVSYDEDVPEAKRHNDAAEALVTGAEVRVTAEQGSDGEWKASRVEILGSN